MTKRLLGFSLAVILILSFQSPLLATSKKDHSNKDSKTTESCLCSGKGHLQSLRITYTGESCDASDHSQDPSVAPCSGDAAGTERVRILSSNKSNINDKKALISFDGIVNLNSSFFIDGVATKHHKLSSRTYVWIYDLSGTLLQELEFHTSCSHPLNPGDKFGSLLLTGGVGNGQQLVDECGVCAGDGTSCLDCADIPGGTTKVDKCGVCGGNDSCLDCNGIPFGMAQVDDCGVCDGDDSTCVDCSGAPFGKAQVDSCGVCNGDNSCLDCFGVPFGSAVVDQCGVCGGDNECDDSRCDCHGVPGGDAEVDLCGECNGSNDCLDCAGVPFGTAEIDECGVCAGSNECLDCQGLPGGSTVVDRCGVCDGAGNSCLDCQTIEIHGIQKVLDGSGLGLKHVVFKMVRDLERLESQRRKDFYNTVREQASDLYIDLWNLTYSFPSSMLQCQETPFCVEVEQATEIASYDMKTTEMKILFESLSRGIRKGIRKSKNPSKTRKKLRKHRRKFHAIEKKLVKNLALIPTSVSQCLLAPGDSPQG